MSSRREIASQSGHRRAQVAVTVRDKPTESSTKMNILFSPYLIFLFVNSFLLMFQFQLVVPTAGVFVENLNVSARLSGLLIGVNQFGTALLQLPLLALFWFVPIKWSLIFLLFLMVIGNLMYALALPARSVAMLFIGRLLCSSTSGLQVGNSIIDMELDDPKLEFTASLYIALVYQLGAVVAYILSAFLNMVVTSSFEPGIQVNSANICGYVAFGVSIIFLSWMTCVLSSRARLNKNTSDKNDKSVKSPKSGDAVESSALTAFIGIAFIFMLDVMEVLRQVSLFELFKKRWKNSGGAIDNISSMTLFASFIFVGILASFPLDFLFKPTPRQIFPAFVGTILSYLLVFPYETDVTASVLLQLFGGILFGFFVRSSFAFSNYLVIDYVKKSRYRRLLLAVNSIAMSCGVAIGGTIATLFQLSIIPHLIATVLTVLLVIVAVVVYFVQTP